MTVEAIALALHHSRAKGTAKIILIGIANHHGDGGAWPALSTLAKYANVSRDNARKALARLIELGEVEREVQGGGLASMADHDRPNRYEIKLRCPGLPSCDGTLNHRDPRTRRVTLPSFAPVIHTPPLGIDPPLGIEGGPPSESTPKPSTNHLPPESTSSSVGNRASETRERCESTGRPHRWNRRWRWCADCSTPMPAGTP